MSIANRISVKDRRQFTKELRLHESMGQLTPDTRVAGFDYNAGEFALHVMMEDHKRRHSKSVAPRKLPVVAGIDRNANAQCAVPGDQRWSRR